jgi:hypothetical protein
MPREKIQDEKNMKRESSDKIQVEEIPFSYVSRCNESLDYKVNVSSYHIEAIVIE